MNATGCLWDFNNVDNMYLFAIIIEKKLTHNNCYASYIITVYIIFIAY